MAESSDRAFTPDEALYVAVTGHHARLPYEGVCHRRRAIARCVAP